jgi:integrase
MTPDELTNHYLVSHDLRPATEKIYQNACTAFKKYFGNGCIESKTRHQILEWRKYFLGTGTSKRSWNTYSRHLKTMWGYALEEELFEQSTSNPFKKTSVTPPKRASKTVSREAIEQARTMLNTQMEIELSSKKRTRITPAWFWLSVYEVFYYTGIRLNALLSLRLKDIDWDNRLILVRADTEKTHREFCIPIMKGLEPHIKRVIDAATAIGFNPDDQIFNVNRFSIHYHSKTMNTDQVEGMYKKLTKDVGIRMTPHRFRHTLATDLMRQPDRNIHLTKSLLNHSNIATTMSYIEVDYDHMRAVLDERSWRQGAFNQERRVDETVLPSAVHPLPVLLPTAPSHQGSTIATTRAQKEPRPPKARDQQKIARIPKENTEKPLEQTTASAQLSFPANRVWSEEYQQEQISRPSATGLSRGLSREDPGESCSEQCLLQPRL